MSAIQDYAEGVSAIRVRNHCFSAAEGGRQQLSRCRGRKSLFCWAGGGGGGCQKIVAEGGPENPQLLRGGVSAIEDFGIENHSLLRGGQQVFRRAKRGVSD